MIRFILVLAVLSISMGIGYLIQTFPAKVNIHVMKYTISTNLIIWALLSILSAMVLLFLFKIIKVIWYSPEIFSRNSLLRKQKKISYLLQSGLRDFYSGNFHRAEKKLVKGGKIAEQIGETSVLFFESAAMAADKLNATERRNNYFLQARQNADGRDMHMLEINEAQTYVSNGDYHIALKLLEKLRANDPKNTKITQLLDTVYVKLERWTDAWRNLASLQQCFSREEFYQRKRTYARAMLKDTADIETYEQLLSAWRQLPATLREEKDIILQYSSSLVENGHSEQAEKLLAQKIKKEFDIDFIQAYCQLHGIDYNRALKNMDSWEKYFTDNALFFYGKANLAYQAKEFILANDYIETSLKLSPTAESFALWGQILEGRNQPEAALAAYRHSVLTTLENKSIQGEVISPIPIPEKFLPIDSTSPTNN